MMGMIGATMPVVFGLEKGVKLVAEVEVEATAPTKARAMAMFGAGAAVEVGMVTEVGLAAVAAALTGTNVHQGGTVSIDLPWSKLVLSHPLVDTTMTMAGIALPSTVSINQPWNRSLIP